MTTDPWPLETYNPPKHVYKMRDEKTGYLQTFPFEENNPMPEAFERTSEYLVKLLDPVTVSYTHLTLPTILRV